MKKLFLLVARFTLFSALFLPTTVSAAESDAGLNQIAGEVLCVPGAINSRNANCANLGPSAYLSRMADMGLTFPLNSMTGQNPDPSLTYVDIRYGEVTRINAKVYASLEDAIKNGEVSAPVVLGRDHHDVSGTDSPFRETSNIYDGSQFTADMAIQNVIGDGFRGATWVSIHNGGGVGWGEVINGGFGMVLDSSEDADRRLKSMLHWDVNNGIARRGWARNEEAIFAIKRAMEAEPMLKVTIPNMVDEDVL